LKDALVIASGGKKIEKEAEKAEKGRLDAG